MAPAPPKKRKIPNTTDENFQLPAQQGRPLAPLPVQPAPVQEQPNFNLTADQIAKIPKANQPTTATSGAQATVDVPKQTKPVVIRDQDTGQLSGLSLPDGKSFLGLSPKEVKGEVESFNNRNALPAGAVEGSEVAAQENATRDLAQQQALGQQIVGDVGQIDPSVLAGMQPGSPSWIQALKSGALTAIASGAGGAAIGSVIPGLGTGAGAITGLIGGFATGVRSNLRQQTSEQIATSATSLRKRETLLRALATDTHNNPAHAAENLMLFNEQISLIDRDHGQLKLQTQGDLSKWLGQDGTSELTRYEVFNSVGGTRELLIREMQTALLNPQPGKAMVSIEDIQENPDLI